MQRPLSPEVRKRRRFCVRFWRCLGPNFNNVTYNDGGWNWGTYRNNVRCSESNGMTDADMAKVTRHMLGQIAIFADGHAKWLRWNQTGDGNSGTCKNQTTKNKWRELAEPNYNP